VFGDLLVEERELGEEWPTVRRVQSFPGSDTDAGVLVDDDLALLEFDEATSAVPVEFGSAAGSCYGEVYGWGATSRAEAGAERLQTARLRVWDDTTCAEHLTALGEPQLSDRLLCAGAVDGAPGACHGDSGGPLFQTRKGGAQVVLGIAVGGGPDCDEYSLFASTDYYGEWVRAAVLGPTAR
jgi:secreted trypsin-like serine protease